MSTYTGDRHTTGAERPGVIVVEESARGIETVWTAADDADMLYKLRIAQDRYDEGEILSVRYTTDADCEQIPDRVLSPDEELEERLEWLRDHLKQLIVIRWEDRDEQIDLDVRNYRLSRLQQAAADLGWLIPPDAGSESTLCVWAEA